jgi:hypothetical protein
LRRERAVDTEYGVELPWSLRMAKVPDIAPPSSPNSATRVTSPGAGRRRVEGFGVGGCSSDGQTVLASGTVVVVCCGMVVVVVCCGWAVGVRDSREAMAGSAGGVVVAVVSLVVVVVVVVVVVLAASGAKQSGIASGKLAPTMQRATTTTVSPSVAAWMMFRKLRTCACRSSLISCPRRTAVAKAARRLAPGFPSRSWTSASWRR